MKKSIIFFVFICCCSIAHAETKHRNASRDIDDPCSCSIGAHAVTSTTRKITLAQAKALVMAALTPQQRRAPGIVIETPDNYPDVISSYQSSNNPRFLRFHVVWAATEGSDLIGWYDVDIYTGDVFDGVASCPTYSNKKLKALQHKVRRSLHLTDVQYQKLKTAGLMCDPD